MFKFFTVLIFLLSVNSYAAQNTTDVLVTGVNFNGGIVTLSGLVKNAGVRQKIESVYVNEVLVNGSKSIAGFECAFDTCPGKIEVEGDEVFVQFDKKDFNGDGKPDFSGRFNIGSLDGEAGEVLFFDHFNVSATQVTETDSNTTKTTLEILF